MSPSNPSSTIKTFIIAYGFFIMFIHSVSHAQENHQIKVQSHPATYFEQSNVDIFLDHEAIGLELQLHMPEVIMMGHKTLFAHYQYFLTLYNQSVPQQAGATNEDYLKTLQALYQYNWELYPNLLSPAHAATQQAAEMLQQQIDELTNDQKFPQSNLEYSDHQQTHSWYKSKVKREINVNLDANAMVKSFFDGIYSIFHIHSLSEVRKGLKFQAKQLDQLSQFTVSYAKQTSSLLDKLTTQLSQLEYLFQAVTTDLALIMISSKMAEEVLDGLNQLYQGFIPTSAMTPSEAQTIFAHLQEQAQASDLHLVIKGPDELYKLKVTTYVKDITPNTKDLSVESFNNDIPTPPPVFDFFLFLTIPTVKPRSGMKAFYFYNNPFTLASGQSAIWNTEEGLFAVQPTIYPQEVHYTFIPSALITRSCRKFPSAWLCDAPVSHRRSCVSDLYYNTSVTCSTTKPIHDNAHMVRGMHPLFYFPEDTEILIMCPETPPTQTKVHGLVQIEDRPGCRLTSNAISYTFNGAKPQVTISKDTHAILPDTVFNFSVPHYYNPKSARVSDQVQQLQESILNYTRSLNETKLENGLGYDDEIILYSIAITALSATSAIGSFCMFHLIKACILHRRSQANPPEGPP